MGSSMSIILSQVGIFEAIILFSVAEVLLQTHQV